MMQAFKKNMVSLCGSVVAIAALNIGTLTETSAQQQEDCAWNGRSLPKIEQTKKIKNAGRVSFFEKGHDEKQEAIAVALDSDTLLVRPHEEGDVRFVLGHRGLNRNGRPVGEMWLQNEAVLYALGTSTEPFTPV